MGRHKQSYLQAMEAANDPASAEDVLGGFAAIGDLKIMWREMADAAPDEIRSDTEAVRDAWAKLEDTAAEGNWAGAMLAGLLNAGAMERVDAYVREHCAVAAVASPTPTVRESEDPSVGLSTPPLKESAPSALVITEDAASLGSLFVDRPYASSEPEARGIYAKGPTTFVSSNGPFEVSATEWFPGEDIEFEGYSVGGPDSQPFVVGVIVVRNPAVDLDPEFFETYVVKVNLLGDLVAKSSVTQSNALQDPNEVVGTINSDAVLFSTYGEEGASTYSYRADDGNLLWQKSGAILASTRTMVVVAELESESCDVAEGVDNESGNVRFALTSQRYDADCLDIDAVWKIGNATVLTRVAVGQRYFDLKLDAAGDLPNQVFDSTTGEAAKLPDSVSFVDPMSNLVVNTPATFLARDADDSTLIVMDTASGEEVFSLPGDRVQALSAEPLFLLDRKLYVQTTDAVLVVDCDSGEVVERNISVYPVDFAGGYVKMSDGSTRAAGAM